MSYCRWSSDDYQCDVYCYEDVGGGFTTHVAGRRYVFKDPLPPPIDIIDIRESPEQWYERDKQVRSMLDASTMEDIELPYAGESFNDPTLIDMLSRLYMLKRIGYRIPDWVAEDIQEEIQQTLNDGESS